MYNKQVFYIADAQGKLINKGSIISITATDSGEMIIKVIEQQKYDHYKNKSKKQITA